MPEYLITGTYRFILVTEDITTARGLFEEGLFDPDDIELGEDYNITEVG
jgi:hypothetical protein